MCFASRRQAAGTPEEFEMAERTDMPPETPTYSEHGASPFVVNGAVSCLKSEIRGVRSVSYFQMRLLTWLPTGSHPMSRCGGLEARRPGEGLRGSKQSGGLHLRQGGAPLGRRRKLSTSEITGGEELRYCCSSRFVFLTMQ
jgi:hypothetical protein